MKITIEMDSNFGVTITPSPKLPTTIAMGMLEHARTLLRADLIKHHMEHPVTEARTCDTEPSTPPPGPKHIPVPDNYQPRG